MPSYTAPFTLNASTPTFSDDFNTFSLSDTRNPSAGGTWQPAYWYATDGIQLVDNGGWTLNPFNPATPISDVYTSDGQGNARIKIEATPSQYIAACGNLPYVCGNITTFLTFRQKYGYFECRMAVGKVQGATGAFWLFSDQGNTGIQIDVVETWSPSGNNNDAWLAAASIWDPATQTLPNSNVWLTYQSGPFVNGWDPSIFHQYGVYWTASTVGIYYDRIKVFEIATPAGYDIPLFPLVSYEVGGTNTPAGPLASSPLPQFLTIDYVKVWTTIPF